MYNSLVLPYFDYCSLVLNNCSQTLKTKVQRLQNRAARVTTGDTYDIRSKDVLCKLGWNNLEERRNSQIISYVNKALHKNCPEGISEMFPISYNDNHNLRSNDLIMRLANHKTNAIKKSFTYAAANIWNSQSISERKKVISSINLYSVLQSIRCIIRIMCFPVLYCYYCNYSVITRPFEKQHFIFS